MNLQKNKPYRNKKLRELPKKRGDINCTMNLWGICNHDPAKVVLSHRKRDGSTGSQKPSDLEACYSCSDCHAEYEENRNSLLWGPRLDEIFIEAMEETHQIALKYGAITAEELKRQGY